jgi:hypothetical protein
VPRKKRPSVRRKAFLSGNSNSTASQANAGRSRSAALRFQWRRPHEDRRHAAISDRASRAPGRLCEKSARRLSAGSHHGVSARRRYRLAAATLADLFGGSARTSRYRHRWQQIDLDTATIHVAIRRSSRSVATVHRVWVGSFVMPEWSGRGWGCSRRSARNSRSSSTCRPVDARRAVLGFGTFGRQYAC